MAKPERKGFASAACEAEPNLVGTMSIWSRVDEMMGQEENLIADVNTQPGLQPCTPVLTSISRTPGWPQQQGCQKTPNYSQVPSTPHVVRAKHALNF